MPTLYRCVLYLDILLAFKLSIWQWCELSLNDYFNYLSYDTHWTQLQQGIVVLTILEHNKNQIFLLKKKVLQISSSFASFYAICDHNWFPPVLAKNDSPWINFFFKALLDIFMWISFWYHTTTSYAPSHLHFHLRMAHWHHPLVWWVCKYRPIWLLQQLN